MCVYFILIFLHYIYFFYCSPTPKSFLTLKIAMYTNKLIKNGTFALAARQWFVNKDFATL